MARIIIAAIMKELLMVIVQSSLCCFNKIDIASTTAPSMRILILFHNFLISTVLTGRVFDDIDEAEKNPGRTLVELKQQCGLYLSGDNDDRIRSSLLIHKIQMAKQHNSGGGKWRAGLSCFSIMSLDERNKVILPTLPPRRNQSDSRNELLERDTMGGEQGILIKYSEEQPVLASCQDLPCQIDWRNMSGKSYVTAIKDQGSCGSCWAFSAAAVLESRLKIMGRVETADVSEEQAVRCTYSSTYNGCNGGHGSAALTYLWFKMNGASNESQYPYTATGGECQSNLQLKYPVQASRAYRSIVNYWSSYNENNRDEIKKALEKGPVMGVIYASSAFDNYKSGVFHCSLADRTAHNHQIVIIGYQDPIPNKDYADGYWLIKNSWGATWGESGFAKISMDINYDCGIAKWEVDAPVMIQDVTIFTMAPSSTETIAVATLIKTNQKPFESASATVEAILITIGIFGSAGVVAVVLYFKRLER